MVESTIRSVDSIAPDMVAVDVETPEGFEARPGQFVLVRAVVDGDTHSGHYTISSPHVTDEFEITVGVDRESGTLGPWLESADPNDGIEIEGPFGETYYEGESPVTILGHGPGIGPTVAIGERACEAGGRVKIVYENDTVPHEDRLEALDAAGNAISITHDRETYIDHAREAIADDQVFVFGFSDFVESTRDLLAELDGDPTPKVEDFGPE